MGVEEVGQTMSLGNVVDELHDEHCLAHTSSSEEPNLASTLVWSEHIHHLPQHFVKETMRRAHQKQSIGSWCKTAPRQRKLKGLLCSQTETASSLMLNNH